MQQLSVAWLIFVSQEIASPLLLSSHFYQMKYLKSRSGQIITLQWQVWYLPSSTSKRKKKGAKKLNYFCFNYWKPHLADYWCRMSQYWKHTWLQYLSRCDWAIWKTRNLEVAVWGLLSIEPWWSGWWTACIKQWFSLLLITVNWITVVSKYH